MNARERARLKAHLLRERILRWVEVDEASGCWIYQGARRRFGYGRMSVRLPGRRHPIPMAVHRVAYWAFKRRPPLGRVIAHAYKCISALCCNPKHLRATTQLRNIRDKKRAAKWRERTLHVLNSPSLDLGVRPNAKRSKPTIPSSAAREKYLDGVPF